MGIFAFAAFGGSEQDAWFLGVGVGRTVLRDRREPVGGAPRRRRRRRRWWVLGKKKTNLTHEKFGRLLMAWHDIGWLSNARIFYPTRHLAREEQGPHALHCIFSLSPFLLTLP